jgi:hypothetical protein
MINRYRWRSPGSLHHVVFWPYTNALEEHTASIFRSDVISPEILKYYKQNLQSATINKTSIYTHIAIKPQIPQDDKCFHLQEFESALPLCVSI